MDAQAKIRQLAEHLARKEAQLAKSMEINRRAAEDLQKYMVLTSTEQGARDVALNVRRVHLSSCKDKGCQWELGFVAWLAHSFGMNAGEIPLSTLKVMMQQYEAKSKAETRGGAIMTPGRMPNVWRDDE